MESLEKHSGISCYLNIAHYIQRWLPFAQMPHHHDWHHEGFKGSNYTFSSIGGIWDIVFDTRVCGRAKTHPSVATKEDFARYVRKSKSFFDHAYRVFIPLLVLPVLLYFKTFPIFF